MKHIKYYNELNESIFASAIFSTLIGVLIGVIVLLPFYQRHNASLSDNFFKNLKRWYKMSRVLRKYDSLIKELDEQFKGDKKLKYYYSRIKKIGDNTIGVHDQTSPLFYVGNLERYIEIKLSEDKKQEFNNLITELNKEIEDIGYDVYGEQQY